MRRIITLLLLIGLQIAAFSQVTPSVYAGVGNHTNIGGVIGIGTEVQYHRLSVNAAIGASHLRSLKENYEYVGDNPFLGFDVGMKYYIYKGLYGGVNYGTLGKAWRGSNNVMNIRDLYGFTFSIGYKLPVYKGWYVMNYIGITSKEEGNRFFLTILPRFGLVLGYSFTKGNL